MEQANLEKTVAEMHKLNEETRKLMNESHKLSAEAALTNKKIKWYELTLFFAAIAATAALTKIFL